MATSSRTSSRVAQRTTRRGSSQTAPTAPTAPDLFSEFGVLPRQRPYGGPSRKFARRTQAAVAMSTTGRALAEVVGLCGAVPASLAVRIAASSTRASVTAHYASVQSLRKAGIVEAIPFRGIGMQRARGLGMVLVPGPEFGIRQDSFWVHDLAPRTRPAEATALAQDVLLMAALLRELALGGRVLRGDAWLTAVAKEPMPWILTGRSDRIARADIGKLLHFPGGLDPLGFVPRDVAEDRLPMLVVGGLGVPLKVLSKVVSVASWVAPLGLLTAHRGARLSERVRRVFAKGIGARGYAPVHFLPRMRGESHRRFWRDVADAVQMGAALRDLLAELRAISAP